MHAEKGNLPRKKASYLGFRQKCVCGGLGRIRTPDPLIRSQVLYPTELPIRVEWDLAPVVI